MKFFITSKSNVKFITTANNQKENVLGEGDVYIEIKEGFLQIKTIIQNVLYVPTLKTNLISLSGLLHDDFKVNFNKECCTIISPGKNIVKAKLTQNGLYQIV